LWFGVPRLVGQPRDSFLSTDEIRNERGDRGETDGNNLQERPTSAAVAAKEERARDAKLAMREYEAEKVAIEVKTARLRALRLAEAGHEDTGGPK